MKQQNKTNKAENIAYPWNINVS